MIEMLPVVAPAPVGANVALNVALCPALITWLADKPLMLKPVPEALAAEIVALELPELVSVTVTDELPPTDTFPKLTLDGFAPSVA